MTSKLTSRRPPTAKIEFCPPQLPTPSEAENSPRPLNSTVTWYYSLADTKIKSVQLHKPGTKPLYVVLETTDDSLFRLEISGNHKQQSRDPSSRQPHAFGAITRISDTMNPSSTLWMNIELSQASEIPTDMQFIISICHGAFQLLDPTMPSHKSLFAFALTASVARKSLPIQTHLIGSTGTALDDFWQKISSLPRVIGQSLWEEDIADQRRNEVREWIFKAAKKQIGRSLIKLLDPHQVPSQSINKDTMDAERRQAIAASIVAWLEFSASQQEAATLAVWDAAWKETWNTRWSKNWEESLNVPTLRQALTAQFGSLYHHHHLRFSATGEDGSLSGIIAGRAAIEASVVAGAADIPNDSILASEKEWSTACSRQVNSTDSKIYAIQCT